MCFANVADQPKKIAALTLSGLTATRINLRTDARHTLCAGLTRPAREVLWLREWKLGEGPGHTSFLPSANRLHSGRLSVGFGKLGVHRSWFPLRGESRAGRAEGEYHIKRRSADGKKSIHAEDPRSPGYPN